MLKDAHLLQFSGLTGRQNRPLGNRNIFKAHQWSICKTVSKWPEWNFSEFQLFLPVEEHMNKGPGVELVSVSIRLTAVSTNVFNWEGFTYRLLFGGENNLKMNLAKHFVMICYLSYLFATCWYPYLSDMGGFFMENQLGSALSSFLLIKTQIIIFTALRTQSGGTFTSYIWTSKYPILFKTQKVINSKCHMLNLI